MTDCYLDDDDGPEVQVIEAAIEGVTPQALCVRVGPVWDDGVLRKEPGIWVEYQEGYQQTPLSGPLLITPEVWCELVRAVEARLVRKMPFWRRVLASLAR